jgi:hypothetical protein
MWIILPLSNAADLAICDFCLFGHMKELLTEVISVDAGDLKNEIMLIWQKCLRTRKSEYLTTGSEDTSA